MSAILLEKLPNNLALYKIAMEEIPQTGQWLTANDKNFALFNYVDGHAQFIASENECFPEKLILTGDILNIEDDESSLLMFADSRAVPLLFFIINQLKTQWGIKRLRAKTSIILMGGDNSFPFIPIPSQIMIPGFSDEIIASSQLLEDFSMPARLACLKSSPGCYDGTLDNMLDEINFHRLIDEDSTILCFGSNSLVQKAKKLFSASCNKQFYVNFE